MAGTFRARAELRRDQREKSRGFQAWSTHLRLTYSVSIFLTYARSIMHGLFDRSWQQGHGRRTGLDMHHSFT